MSQSLVQLLEWDSNFLGFLVGKLVAQQVSTTSLSVLVDQSRATGIRLIYMAVDPADGAMAAAAHQVGARLVDQKMTFCRETSMPLPAGQAPESREGAVFSTAIFTPALEELAWQSGEFSRFRRDGRFAAGVFQNLYSQWLRASLTGALARTVLAYSLPKGGEVGLLTLGQQEGLAHIGLLAVATTARRQGIGHLLIETARQKAHRWGCPTLQVVTQRANEPACRFYAQCGFEVVREEHIYHLWL